MRDLWIRRACMAVLALTFLINIGFHLESFLSPATAAAVYSHGISSYLLLLLHLLACACVVFLSLRRPSWTARRTAPGPQFQSYALLALAFSVGWYLMSWWALLMADRQLTAEDLPIYILLIASPALLILVYGAVVIRIPAAGLGAVITRLFVKVPVGWLALFGIGGGGLVLLVLIPLVLASLFPHPLSAAKEPIYQLRTSIATPAVLCFEWFILNIDSLRAAPAPADSLANGARRRPITQKLD